MFFFKYASKAPRSYFTVRPVLQRGKSPAPCENRFYSVLPSGRGAGPMDRAPYSLCVGDTPPVGELSVRSWLDKVIENTYQGAH